MPALHFGHRLDDELLEHRQVGACFMIFCSNAISLAVAALLFVGPGSDVLIDAGLVTRPLRLEPIEHVSIDTKGNGLLRDRLDERGGRPEILGPVPQVPW